MHTINLEPGFKPKYQRAYRIPEKLKPEVDRQIDDLLKDGKITPSNSLYCRPIELVFKPDKSISICVDYRSVNSGTINDAFPMPRIDDILERMALAEFITTLDCTQTGLRFIYQSQFIDLIYQSQRSVRFPLHAGWFALCRKFVSTCN